MAIPLEDNFTDVIGKAQRGLGISDSQLAAKSGASMDAIRRVRDGHFDRNTIERVAPILQLNPGALIDLAQEKYQPNEIKLDGLAQFNTPYHDMQVNAYLVWDGASGEAVAFDSGATCSSMLQFAKEDRLTIRLILLTHAHPDHVADLDRLTEATGATAYLSSRESAPGAHPIEEGKSFKVGK
ncbi:MAG TPA: MBL fold metallo-hydrolase, partial [Chthoniobacterales bacterium]